MAGAAEARALGEVEKSEVRHGKDDPRCDGLTGLGSRYALECDLSLQLERAAATEARRFKSGYACFDIDDFQAFLDHHGYRPADELLMGLATQLRRRYPNKSIYRFAGDQFIIAAEACLPAPLEIAPGVEVRRALLRCDTAVQAHRQGRVRKWILLHIQEALLRSTASGLNLVCGDFER